MTFAAWVVVYFRHTSSMSAASSAAAGDSESESRARGFSGTLPAFARTGRRATASGTNCTPLIYRWEANPPATLRPAQAVVKCVFGRRQRVSVARVALRPQ